jgi:putative peptidoglycan lipid II flippase
MQLFEQARRNCLVTEISFWVEALLISVLHLLSKFIGFFYEVLIANYFGATGQTDAFIVAAMIPGSILGLFAGTFSTLVIPFYLERKSKREEAARKFVYSALLVWGSVFVVMSIASLRTM